MARLARVVVPGLAHHITQRGNRRERIFLRPGDEQAYRAFLAEQLRRFEVEAWAYCLMPNHVHLILVPATESGLSLAVGEAHRRYTSFINDREGWSGHLFQGRFHSVVMDEGRLLSAARYVALNPVRARLVERAEAWPWSSARAHLAGRDDCLVSVRPLLERAEATQLLGWSEYDAPLWEALRAAVKTGRPLGSPHFVSTLEGRVGRRLAPQRRGRKPVELSRAPLL
ncbi:MAG TPA: transposase [Phenylobacterium sp.]